MQKKIVFVNTVCSSGSTGRIVYELYKRATEHGYKCAVAYGRGTAAGVPECDAYKIGSTASLYKAALISRLDDREGFHLKAQTKKFLRFLDSFRPDIIHLHNIHGYYLNCELLFSYLASHREIKVVWTLHDMWALTGHCAVVDLDTCPKWIDGCHSCKRLYEYPKSALFDSSRKNYAQKKALFSSVENMTLVTPSEWLMQNVKRSYLKNKDVTVINNGIDLTCFCPTDSDLRKKHGLENKTVILGVSFVWLRAKGFDDFLALRKLLPDDFVIVLVGVDEKTAQSLPGGVIGISRTESREELAAWYTAADYFVNLTYYDTFPTVNLESLACGTPVITYRTGGSPESLTDKCGVVSEKGSVERVAGILKGKPRFSVEDCVRRAGKYDKNNALKGYLEIYDR